MKKPDGLPCLSLRSPWSLLLVEPGMKDCENRSTHMRYRGRLLIHSSRMWDLRWFERPIPPTVEELIWRWMEAKPRTYPHGGVVIGSVVVTGCTRQCSSPYHEDGAWGIYIDPKQTDKWPREKWLPYRGSVGMFYVPRTMLPEGVRTDGFQ